MGVFNKSIYIGRKYGRLTVLDAFRENKRTYLTCLCECGATITRATFCLRSGKTKSCGCLWRDKMTKHGLCGIKEYRAWQHMLRRCDNFKDKKAHLYAKKGITVCESWKEFVVFLADMGMAPTQNHSIDRINGNLGYFKENCRWATKLEQARNTNANRMLVFNGEKRCLYEWAAKYGIHPTTFTKRLKRGLSVEEALLKPIDTAYRRIRKK